MTQAALADDTPFYILFNAASGSGDAAERRALIERTLQGSGKTYQLMPIESAAQIADVGRRAVDAAVRHSGAVIVAGGDGTINSVAQAVLPSGRPFGILPQGTFNYSSRAHGVPLDFEEALRSLLDARIEPVQVGLVNDRAFLVNASLGLYPELLQDREQYKRKYGRKRIVAIWSALATLMREHRPLVVEIEQGSATERLSTYSIFVGNNPLQLERIGLSEAEDVKQRRLAAILVRPLSRAQLLGLALRGALGQLAEDRNVRNFSFRSMVVTPLGKGYKRGIKVAADGEIFWMQPPLRFAVAAQPLLLMVPSDATGAGT
ncbi:MAG TPA: diacylglycerol kinase family protein [Steroidobacter sp.]|jgi:diacylglycerol kinase family enzyme